MATIGHVAAGVALAGMRSPRPSALFVAVVAAVAMLPDIDFLLPIDHRGPTHSVAFAAVVGVVAAGALRALRRPYAAAALLAAAAVMSHIGLDLVTAHAPVKMLWPFSGAEYSLDAVLLPAAPTDDALFTLRGAALLLVEILWSAAIVAAGWFIGALRRRRGRASRTVVARP